MVESLLPLAARSRTTALLRLIRPPDTAIALVATLVGARLAGLGAGELVTIAAVGLSNMLLIAASMAFNDWHDVGEDAINRPHAPIPQGRVTPEEALAMAAALFAAAIVVSAWVEPWLGVAAVAFTALSLAYTLCLKRLPLVGNALVATLSSYALWCWMLLYAASRSAVYGAIALGLALFCLGREIFGTARDAPGDAACRIPTVATLLGGRTANRLGAALIAVAAVIAWFPVWAQQAGWLYVLLLASSCALVGVQLAHAFSPPVTEAPAATGGRLVALSRLITVVMAAACALGL